MKRLISHGYFPAELPTPFVSTHFADFAGSTVKPPAPFSYDKNNGPSYISRPLIYNLARAGSLRRVLSIPNPINFYQQAKLLATLWPKLDLYYKKTNKALSRPIKVSSGSRRRAYEWAKGFGEISVERLTLRTGMRYALQTDIKNFYPSIYTHSIPWALHTKETSQAKTKFFQLTGNKIDRLIQNGQSRQTKGIPIGPDTSLLWSEIILSRIDRHLVKASGGRYFRYADDYEFCFSTFNEAEHGLAAFQESLAKFELTANEAKTRIIEIPAPLEESWPRSLRSLPIEGVDKPKHQRTHLIDVFDTALETRKTFPDQGVIKYAVARTSSSVIDKSNWSLYQQMLCQWAQVEPAVLPVVIDILAAYRRAGYSLDNALLDQLFFTLVDVHAPRGHTSEVAWTLWAHLLFGIKLHSKAMKTIERIDNSVIALLTLNASKRGLLPSKGGFSLWKAHMTPAALEAEHWLLAYEARLKKWLPPVGSKEYVKTATGFGLLGKAGVSFYDENKHVAYVPPDPKLLYLKLSLLKAQATASAADM